ncbi:hypothetical protein ACFL9U_07190 [Thermodesulfobacteriota bacterium]
MEALYSESLNDTLKNLRDQITLLSEMLRLRDSMDPTALVNIIDKKLIPRFSPDSPLIAAICGGGSSGKSSLFNALVGGNISPVGGYAGINRRVLVGAGEDCLKQKDFLTALFEPFGCAPEPLKDIKDLTVPGSPLYLSERSIPANLVLMDTPDFDTGSKGVYINRDLARQALEASDILVYIFTNSNYNNRDNTDFISQMLTGIGMRKCFLVYRVYPSFREQEVVDHAMTVGRNLYGREAETHILGIYRADEDNTVAAGQRLMELRPVRNQDQSLISALQGIDHRRQRIELVSSILSDTVDLTTDILKHTEISLAELRLYRDALQTAQSHCVHEALQHFPMDLVVKRFAEIWLSTDPPHIKAMRKLGSIVEFPVKMIAGTIKWAKEQMRTEKSAEASRIFKDTVEEDLVSALHHLHIKAIDPVISVTAFSKDPIAQNMRETIEKIRASKGNSSKETPNFEGSDATGFLTFSIEAHPVVTNEQQKLRDQDWRTILKTILSQKETIFNITEAIDVELSALVDDFRGKMDLWARISQTFSAFMNVLPATAAVTYILATGDPVGATGIKVKLAGLFGIKDLYALVAIPATTGLKKADQKQLEVLLGPIAKAWLDNKLNAVQELFEQMITRGIIKSASDALRDADEIIKEIEASMVSCRKAVKPS